MGRADAAICASQDDRCTVLCDRRRFPAVVLQLATQAEFCSIQFVASRIQISSRPAATSVRSNTNRNGLCQHDDRVARRCTRLRRGTKRDPAESNRSGITMIGLPNSTPIYLCTDPVDFRKGFDGLTGIVTTSLGHGVTRVLGRFLRFLGTQTFEVLGDTHVCRPGRAHFGDGSLFLHCQVNGDRTWRAVVSRHRKLRTAFATPQSTPVPGESATFGATHHPS